MSLTTDLIQQSLVDAAMMSQSFNALLLSAMMTIMLFALILFGSPVSMSIITTIHKYCCFLTKSIKGYSTSLWKKIFKQTCPLRLAMALMIFNADVVCANPVMQNMVFKRSIHHTTTTNHNNKSQHLRSGHHSHLRYNDNDIDGNGAQLRPEGVVHYRFHEDRIDDDDVVSTDQKLYPATDATVIDTMDDDKSIVEEVISDDTMPSNIRFQADTSNSQVSVTTEVQIVDPFTVITATAVVMKAVSTSMKVAIFGYEKLLNHLGHHKLQVLESEYKEVLSKDQDILLKASAATQHADDVINMIIVKSYEHELQIPDLYSGFTTPEGRRFHCFVFSLLTISLTPSMVTQYQKHCDRDMLTANTIKTSDKHSNTFEKIVSSKKSRSTQEEGGEETREKVENVANAAECVANAAALNYEQILVCIAEATPNKMVRNAGQAAYLGFELFELGELMFEGLMRTVEHRMDSDFSTSEE